MSSGIVIGYDPGGNGKHGIAALHVERRGERWVPRRIETEIAEFLSDAVGWLTTACQGERILAAGVDTLTEWNGGRSGFRPADRWLKHAYPTVAPSVVAPASLYGSMAINGAAFLALLGPRFQADSTLVTEAHPKVCYFALTGKKVAPALGGDEMAGWLAGELGLESAVGIAGAADHGFDAALSALAALRGLNGEWRLDLHALPEPEWNSSERVLFCGQTHYWWPRAEPQPE